MERVLRIIIFFQKINNKFIKYTSNRFEHAMYIHTLASRIWCNFKWRAFTLTILLENRKIFKFYFGF